MAPKSARKAVAAEAMREPSPAAARPVRQDAAPLRDSLDPLILALTRAVDRQAPSRPFGRRNDRAG
jgi:hypothetical protein